jgi:UDP-N-acetyl-alpha-D-muramoyl-L-alanyl-L-glutamate epimerase
MTVPAAHGDRFLYDGYELDPPGRRLVCHYSNRGLHFVEEVSFGEGCTGDPDVWGSDAVDAAARIVFLLAGVSYYKTAAPPVVDFGGTTTLEEARFLESFYVNGLAEFAHRNGLDLSAITYEGPASGGRPLAPWPAARPGTPLLPFGGGIDSIVTVDAVRRRLPGASLFVVSRAGDRFEAIERAAAATGLPVVRADRLVDPSLLGANGFLNGHVPVTGILSAIAVMAAALGGHDAVVMSNERSASVPTLTLDSREVNHQWSKGLAFEEGFRRLLAATFDPAPEYFSYLRDRSELWVAARFARLDRYHAVFRSCNRAFHIDPARRLAHWCGSCDKCCFIDLVLAPFMDAAELRNVFSGREPLDDPALAPRFRALLDVGGAARPFECVGEPDECRVAAVLAAGRPDRAGCTVLRDLAAAATAALADHGIRAPEAAARLLAAEGPHFVPAGYGTESDHDAVPAGAPAGAASP